MHETKLHVQISNYAIIYLFILLTSKSPDVTPDVTAEHNSNTVWISVQLETIYIRARVMREANDKSSRS